MNITISGHASSLPFWHAYGTIERLWTQPHHWMLQSIGTAFSWWTSKRFAFYLFLILNWLDKRVLKLTNQQYQLFLEIIGFLGETQTFPETFSMFISLCHMSLAKNNITFPSVGQNQRLLIILLKIKLSQMPIARMNSLVILSSLIIGWAPDSNWNPTATNWPLDC